MAARGREIISSALALKGVGYPCLSREGAGISGSGTHSSTSPRVAIPGDVIVFVTDFREERKCDLFVAELFNVFFFSSGSYDVNVLLMVPSFFWRQLETCL